MSNKLPVWKIAKASYGVIFRSFGSFLAKTWAWTIFALVLSEFLGFLMGAIPTAISDYPIQTFIPSLALYGLAVIWHRSLLLGEDLKGFRAIRFPFRVWKFLGVAVLFVFCVFFPLYLLGEIVQSPRGGLAILLTFLFGALGLSGAFFYVGLRLSLAYPLIAIDETNVFDKSWALLKGNLWRVIGIGCLVYFPIAVLMQILAWGLARIESTALNWTFFAQTFVIDILTIVALVIATSVWAGAGSLMLMHLRGIPFPARQR